MLDTSAHASSLKKYGLHARTLERTPSSTDTQGGRHQPRETTVVARIHSHKSGTTETEFSSETESRTPKSRGSGSFVGSGTTTEDLRLCKHELTGSSPEEKRDNKRSSGTSIPSLSRIEKVLGKDVSDEPIDFRALRQDIRQLEKETIRRRQEIVRPTPNGGQEIWAELKSGVLSSGGDSVLSPAPAYRSLRSLTPEDADDSFHETFEKELVRRRRRRRSASCSSRCCESERCCRGLDSGQSRSTHSVTGASSRNSSSRSEKSSTRSSRSPSIEQMKQGDTKSNLMTIFSLKTQCLSIQVAVLPHVARGPAFARDEGGYAAGELVTRPQSPALGASLNIFPIRTLGQCRSVAPAALFYPNSELKSAPISWTIWTVTQMLKPVGAAILLCVYYTSIQYYFSTKTSEFMKKFSKEKSKTKSISMHSQPVQDMICLYFMLTPINLDGIFIQILATDTT